MKRFLLLLCLTSIVVLLAVTLISCDEQPVVTEAESTSTVIETTTELPVTTEVLVNGLPNYVDGKLFIIEDGKTNYQVVYPKNATANLNGGSFFSSALTQVRKVFKNYGLQMVTIANDFSASEGSSTGVLSDYEILIGNTNRAESDISDQTLAFNQALIRVVGKKVVISSNNYAVTAMAVLAFLDRYMPDGGKSVLLPADLNEVITVAFTTCLPLGMSYAEMGEATLSAYNDSFWDGKWVNTGRFWTGAEVLESYIDVYEATGAKKDKEAMVSYANQFIKAWGSTWGGISYNDDLMWGSIAFARLAKLTRDPMYLNIAKQNFDLNWKRAWDDTLGGGLWWRSQKDSKNACVNGPGAIAACLLGDLTGDEGYYQKAKSIIDWMLAELYVPETGRVIDSYSTSGEKSDYASTYNQGTFIGACTYLYQHYKDAKYLAYAKKSCEFSMTQLATKGILDLESNVKNADLPGFKAILIRWMYRYAKETNDIDSFVFIQQNATKAFQNRNADGLIWTGWGGKTPNEATRNKEYLWGSSTAITLMYSCFPWW